MSGERTDPIRTTQEHVVHGGHEVCIHGTPREERTHKQCMHCIVHEVVNPISLPVISSKDVPYNELHRRPSSTNWMDLGHACYPQTARSQHEPATAAGRHCGSAENHDGPSLLLDCSLARDNDQGVIRNCASFTSYRPTSLAMESTNGTKTHTSHLAMIVLTRPKKKPTARHAHPRAKTSNTRGKFR
jgi:hypothetical protein